MKTLSFCAAIFGTLLLSACAGNTNSEDGRSEPIEMSQFTAGSNRLSVAESIGEPSGTITNGGRQCDIYHLFTRGMTSGEKAGMKAAEVITSIGTLGLAQIIWAPVNAGIHPNIHTVLFCYAHDGQLVDIYDKNPTHSSAPTHHILNKALYVNDTTPSTGSSITSGHSSAPAPATAPIAGPISAEPFTPSVTPAAAPTVASDPNAPIQAEPSADAGTETAGANEPPPIPESEIDHKVTDPETGVITYYRKAVVPMAAPATGTVSLENVSREATTQNGQVKDSAVIIKPGATADDLNSISHQQSARANASAMGDSASVQH